MEIKTKFDIGQKVWVVNKDYKSYKADCSVCLGEGALHNIKNKYVKCNNYKCSDGKIYEQEHFWIIEQITIEYLEILDNNQIYYMYKEDTGDSGYSIHSFPESDVFISAGESETEMNKRNKVKK